MQKKILFVITKSNWGGAQRYVYDLARKLPRDRYLSVVACGGNGILVQELKNQEIKTIPVLGFQRDIHLGKEFQVFFELLSLYKRERPHIIHLNSSKAGGIGALAAWIYGWMPGVSRPRTIFTAHGWGFHEDRGALSRILIYCASWATALFCDTVITINRNDTESAKKFISSEKIIFIPNGIEPPSLLSRSEARKKLSAACGVHLTDAETLIGTIAELTPNKGHFYLLKAFSSLKGDYSSFKAILIGDGELREAIKADIRSEGLERTVFLAGFLEHAEVYLSAFDFFVLPSVKEGLPYTLLEAMAAGVPVVATRVGGMPDLIREGKSGLLVSPKNIQELARALTLMLEKKESWHDYSANAKTVIEEKHTLKRMIENTTRVYEKSS